MQSHQHSEELWRFPHLLTQLARPGIGLFDLRRRIAFGGHEHRAQGRLQEQLLLRALRGRRQSLQQLQRLGEMTDGFLMSAPPDGILASVLEILHRTLGIPPTHKMRRQFCCQFSTPGAIAHRRELK